VESPLVRSLTLIEPVYFAAVMHSDEPMLAEAETRQRGAGCCFAKVKRRAVSTATGGVMHAGRRFPSGCGSI
jgi:hypothetical protein